MHIYAEGGNMEIQAAIVLIILSYPIFIFLKNRKALTPVAKAKTLLESDTKK